MQLNSLYFIFTFLPCILILYFIVPTKFKDLFLVLISLFFYAWGDPKYVILLIFTILFNYLLGIFIDVQEGKKRKSLFIFALLINVFILVYFKYYGFILDNLFHFIPNIKYQLLPIPLGVSFFTFQVIGYLCDVYRKQTKPQYTFVSFALYVSFFPKLLIGPITPYTEMKKEIFSHPFSRPLFDKGAKRFVIGLAQKVILADTFAFLWMTCSSSTLSVLGSWLGIIAFTFQIYFDFCGYSHMAIGLANMFGFHLVENFNYPYLSKSISEFWRRWHISLGIWFKTYIYIPLGGNRVGALKHIRNISIVWIITGLWHGASYNFILWGLYYAILVTLEKYVFKNMKEKLPAIVNGMITFFLVMIGWVFFVNTNINDAFHYLASLFHLNHNLIVDAGSLYNLKTYAFYLIVALIASTPLIKNLNLYLSNKYTNVMSMINLLAIAFLLVICISFMINASYQSFLYASF